jgi:NOL1/NOP2/sun family putative RNA methylase
MSIHFNLPEAFLKRMQCLPDFDYSNFIKSYDAPPFRGLRVNTLKCKPELFSEISPFTLEKSPFDDCGFYVGTGASGRHPWHHAGVFYLQESSAMSAVTALDVRPGMKVLDLCAAPGGKSTQAAAKLLGDGFILCNEIIPSRAAVLLSNIERCGVRNAAVTNEKPEKLCPKLEGFFDRVLVDAPCSGEGMFRREPAAAAEWTEQTPVACAKRQLGILEEACKTVAQGGVLVYSTCTFSPDENEGVVDAFLKNHPEFAIEPIDDRFGSVARPDWADAAAEIANARRVFPFDGGEGHFVARMRRTDGGIPSRSTNALKPADKEAAKLFNAFYSSQFSDEPYGNLFKIGGRIFMLPEFLPDLHGINLLRAGVLAGNIKGKRFEPSHALYLAAKAEAAQNKADFSLDDERLAAFLHGEQVDAPEGCSKGYAGVMAQGYIVGFGKVSDGVLKNHYPKGLRNL